MLNTYWDYKCNGLSPIKGLGHPRPTPTPPTDYDYDIQTHPRVSRYTDQRSEHLIRRPGMRPRHGSNGPHLKNAPTRMTDRRYACTGKQLTGRFRLVLYEWL